MSEATTGLSLPGNVQCAKGPIPYCLDELSKRPGARKLLITLRDALTSLAPTYQGLEDVFDEHLMSLVLTGQQARRRIVDHLRSHWFDAASSDAYFPNQQVSRIYAVGVLKTLELSLKGRRRVVPINAWWLVDASEVRMLTLADVDQQGFTIGGRVTLLILSPRPQGQGENRSPIMGDTAGAWVTEQQGDRIATFKINELRWGLSR